MNEEIFAAFASWTPILFMVLIFYFMLYRPQKNARKERDEMLSNLKKGSRIITIGGIYGTITELNEDTIKLKIADNVEIEIIKNAVNNVVEK